MGWELYPDGGSLRHIARYAKAARQPVTYWVTGLTEAFAAIPLPAKVKDSEMDELFTFIGDKKTKPTLLLLRSQTRCIFGWALVWIHMHEAIQQVVDKAPKFK